MLEMTPEAAWPSLLCHESLPVLGEHCASGGVLGLLRNPEAMTVPPHPPNPSQNSWVKCHQPCPGSAQVCYPRASADTQYSVAPPAVHVIILHVAQCCGWGRVSLHKLRWKMWRFCLLCQGNGRVVMWMKLWLQADQVWPRGASRKVALAFMSR